MSSILEEIYYRSPTLVQNLAVSAYGLRLRNQRFGGKHREYAEQLQASQHLSQSDMESLQVHELQRLLKHAFTTVPYYRGISQSKRFSAADFQKIEHLRELPIIDKDAVRDKPGFFVSSKLQNKAFPLHTSGTSGKPLTIYCDNDSRRRHYAFWRRLRGWFGISPEMRRATFFGRIILSPEDENPPFWRYDAFQRNYLFSSYHMSKENLKHYYEALAQIRPDEIIGYPSSLFVLAKYLKQNGLSLARPKAVFTTAETLLEHQRSLIEESFQQKVTDQYGCTEMALFVSQCENGTYHIHPEHGIVEILDEDGNPAESGTEGEVVCTGFVNYAMPLIRYRLGDELALGNEACPCGRSFPVVKQIIGRVDDILMTPAGRPLGRLDPVFKGLSDIYETQIIQSAPDRLTFKMAVGPQFSDRKKAQLLHEVRKRVGNEMTIEFDLVDEIPKDKNGKFRAVISTMQKIS